VHACRARYKREYLVLKDINIGGRLVGCGQPPFIVAELSGNHNQSLDRALEIVEAAASSGAHALKLQTYTADTMTLDIDEREFLITDVDSPWAGRNLYDLYHEAHTPWDWHEKIFARARELGLIAFSAPFDGSAVEFLESLDTPCYKIASFENTDHALIRKVASTGKPIIISAGMATAGELDDSVRIARESGCDEIIILKCTSTYPASPDNTNIKTIPHMRQLLDCHTGLSDHTLGIGVAVAAVAFGAVLIEKHFTLRRSDGGVDAAFSMEPAEMAALVDETGRAWQSLGHVQYGPTNSERSSLSFRRSLYIVSRMKAGDVVAPSDIRVVRPGFGLAPGYVDDIIGLRIRKDVEPGTAVSWDLFK
jgi:N-acetylneuraminate synthase